MLLRILRRSATRAATCIYQFITNNHAFFTCGERKIYLKMKKYQNIRNIIVESDEFDRENTLFRSNSFVT